MHLTLNDHRVDLNPDVIDSHVLAHCHPSRVGVDLHRRQVCPVRVGEVLRVNRRLSLQCRFDSIGQVVGGKRLEGDRSQRLRLLRVSFDGELSVGEFEVSGRALELMRSDDLGLLDEVVGGLLDGLPTDSQRA